jgi:acyl carrier protein
VAQWLAERGASKLVLIGRHAAGTVPVDGAAIECHKVDVADREAVDALVRATGPLEGIVHLAGVLDDGVIEGQTWERFEAVMRPKATGAWNLHEVAGDVPHFVLFSSAASLLGSPGQANYAAANAYLDALAGYRAARKLPALSIQWGAWAGAGMAARSERRTMSLLQPMRPAECLDALERVMTARHSSVAILSADWQQWHAMPGRSRTEVAIGNATRRDGPATADLSIVASLSALPPGRRRKAAIDFVRQQAVRILGLGGSYQIAGEEPLIRLGLDSLMALELRNTLAQAFGRPLSATLLFDHPTIAALADYLTPATAAIPAAPETRRDLLLEEISTMSDEEAEQLLAQELSSGSGS